MVCYLADAHRESSYGGRQQQVCTAGCLASPFQCAVVHRTYLIGMIAEVGGRACIVEREGDTYEQCGFVVAHGEWAAEGGTCFAVVQVGIGKEHAVFC